MQRTEQSNGHSNLTNSPGLGRRAFLRSAGALTAASGVITNLAACDRGEASHAPGPVERSPGYWDRVRERFLLDPDYIHLSLMLLAPHPQRVREAITYHREALDRNPSQYLADHDAQLRRRSRQHAARYIGGELADVGLTDSTTMGIGLVYNGLHVRADQEILVSDHDYPRTHTALDFKASRSGATVRRYDLYDDVRTTSTDELVSNVINAIRPETRVLAATWVHSKTGLKLPVRAIADELARINADRDPEDRVLFCVDGAHGLGADMELVTRLGCDFFFAGTHKWMFGPHGTGIIWGHPDVQDQITPTIPTFTGDGTWGASMTPGGFQAFEHQWSMAEAFAFHQELGRLRIHDRIHTLAQQLMDGLAEIEGVTLWTPRDASLSAGIVCFEVEGLSPSAVVDALSERRIIASTTPYTPTFARFSPGILNNEREIEQTLDAVRDIA